jgi:serine/threonine protein kinase
MSEEEALRIIVQVAHGLHRAHRQGMIHRDVKPDNILLSRTGEAKLTDLGLAKDVDASIDLTRTGRGLGTPNYMAPEQFRNAKNASICCDIYSLGATLYEMVTGEMPFGVTDPVQVMMRKLKNELPAPRNIVPTLSERVDWAIRRALSADPKHRPSTCREFVEDLTGQSTRLGDDIDDEARTDDVWYVVYTAGDDTVRTMQGSTQEVRAALREEKLGKSDMVRASRSKTGPFDPLLLFLEFRDLVVKPGEGPPLSEASSANLAKLGRLIQAAQETPHPPSSKSGRGGGAAPARDGAVPAAPADAPHYRLPDSSARASSSDRAPEGLKLAVMFLLGIIASFLAFKYLLPLLNP